MVERLPRDLGPQGQDDLRLAGGAGAPVSVRRLGFSHPEYPLGLPFLYAGVAFLTGRWDDHALALLFPLFQIATLAVAVGWLRRRGVPRTAALLAAAILAQLRAALLGLPDRAGGGAPVVRRPALRHRARGLARGRAGATGRVPAAGGLGRRSRGDQERGPLPGRRGVRDRPGVRRPSALEDRGGGASDRAARPPPPPRSGAASLPLRDFDFGLFSVARLGEGLSAASLVLGLAGWAGAVLVAALVALGRRRPDADALLALAACAGAAYLILPVFAVRGPAWLVQTTLARVSSAWRRSRRRRSRCATRPTSRGRPSGPGRARGASIGCAGRPRASGRRLGRRGPSTRAS